MKLTDAQLRNLSEPGRYFDGGGLYLELTGAGGRYWRLKYRHGGKEKRLAFGVYPEVSLKGARAQSAEARKVLKSGGDPGELRKTEKAKAQHEAVNTLEAVARDWMHTRPAAGMPQRLGASGALLKPTFSRRWVSRPLVCIKPGEVMVAVKKIEATWSARTRRAACCSGSRPYLRWAVMHERIGTNPDARPGVL